MGLFKDSGVTQAQLDKNMKNAQNLLDLFGFYDPTPIADGLNAFAYLLEGDKKNAIISAAAMLPYVGDTAKAGRTVAKAGKLADKVSDAGRSAKPILKEAQLPTKGKIRYVPLEKWTSSQPLPKQNGDIVDKFGNVWTKEPSRTEGRAFKIWEYSDLT